MTVALATVVLLISGCARGPDWAGQVGVMTYDQAILELGPPDKMAELTDGTRVAEWLTHRGRGSGVVHGYYGGPYYGPYPGYFCGPSVWYEPGAPDYWVRLTFGPDGRLATWKKVTR